MLHGPELDGPERLQPKCPWSCWACCWSCCCFYFLKNYKKIQTAALRAPVQVYEYMIKCIQQKQQQLQQQPQQLQGHFGNFFHNVQTHLAQTHLAFSDPTAFRRSCLSVDTRVSSPDLVASDLGAKPPTFLLFTISRIPKIQLNSWCLRPSGTRKRTPRSNLPQGPFGIRSGSVRGPFGPISNQNSRSQKFQNFSTCAAVAAAAGAL